jgi:hypothetical protein
MDAESMLDLGLSQIMQGRLPRAHLLEHIGYGLGNQDVPVFSPEKAGGGG